MRNTNTILQVLQCVFFWISCCSLHVASATLDVIAVWWTEEGRWGWLESANLAALITLTHSCESLKQVAADHFLILCVQIQFKLNIKLPCPSRCWFCLHFFISHFQTSICIIYDVSSSATSYLIKLHFSVAFKCGMVGDCKEREVWGLVCQGTFVLLSGASQCWEMVISNYSHARGL